MKRLFLFLLTAVCLFGQSQNVTVIPSPGSGGMNTGTFSTQGINYYLGKTGTTWDFSQVTLILPSSLAFVSTITAGAGINVSQSTGAVTISNTGVLAITPGSGITESIVGGTVTLNNSGVLAITAGNGVSVSGTQANITINAIAAGTVTNVTGTGSVNGITLTGNVTTSGSLTLGGTLSGISNSQLTNNSITVTAGTGLSGGGTVALGGTITLNASGGGTVSSVSVSPNSGVTAGVTNSTTTPTISIGLGAITPTSVTTNTMTFGVNTGVLTVTTGTVGSAAITGSGQAVFNSGPSISAPTITGAATAVNLTTSGLESVANLKTSGLTGYLYGNSTTNVTASTTIPTSSLSGSVSLTSQVSGILPIANGGTGSSTASLVAGTGIAITGTFPNQTINATSGTGTVTSVAGTGTVQGITLTGTVTTSGSLTLGGSLSPIALATQVSGTLNASSGGTGVAGTITGYEYANGTGAHTASTTIPTTALSGTITNAQLTNNSITVTAGSGLSGGGSVALGGTTTLTNAGVTNIVAGTGITVNAATGSVTINSTATGGVSSITGTTNQVIASASTGAVTLSTPQSIATTSTPQFARMGLGIPADPNVGLLTLFSPTASPSFGFETAGSWAPNANSQTYTNAYLQSGISGSTYTGSTYYNLYLGSGTSSGNLANAYQLYIGALSSGTTGTTKYGIYQAGTDANLLSGTLSVSNSTSSTSTTSGALQVNGGVGVGGNGYFGGNGSFTGGQVILNANTANYLYFKNASKLVFSDTVGNERMTLDSAGNVGIGVTPSAWGNYDAGTIQKSYGAFWASYNNQSVFGLNCYYNGGWIYSNSDNASFYLQNAGKHIWLTAPSGTAGNAISFTQAMTLDASGNLGIGTSSPSYPLMVQKNSTSGTRNVLAQFYDGNYYPSGNPTINLAGFTSGGNLVSADIAMQFNSTPVGLSFGVSSFAGGTPVKYHYLDTYGQTMLGTTTPVATGAGSLTVGATTASTSTTSGALQVAGGLGVGGALNVGGSIGNAINNTGYQGNTTLTIGNNITTGDVLRVVANSSTTAYNANLINFLNASNSGVGSIYTNGTSTAYNTTSDKRLKTNFHSWSLGDKFDDLLIGEFTWKSNGSIAHGTLAQDLYEIYPDAVHVGGDAAKDPWSVDYGKLTVPLIAEVKSLRSRVKTLEQEQATTTQQLNDLTAKFNQYISTHP